MNTGSFMRSACCVLLLLPLAACDEGKGDVNLDALQTQAGKLRAVMARSLEGVDLDPRERPPAKDPDALKRLLVDRELRDAGLELLMLRNQLLFEKRISEKEARDMHWPEWIEDPPESTMSPVDLQERFEWLDAQVRLLAEHGCRIGREKRNDPKFCDVP